MTLLKSPAHEVYRRRREKRYSRAGHGRAKPFGVIGDEVEGEGHLGGHYREKEEEGDGDKLSGRSGVAGPVPSQAIPPEGQGDFCAHAIGRIKQATAAQGDEGALAGGAFEGLGVAVSLEHAAGTPRTWVRLAGADDLLSERNVLIGRIEHF